MSAAQTPRLIERATGLLVIEVRNSNPNGDPDRDSDPRQRPDRLGEITPVSFKRKMRDLVEVKDGPVWQTLSESMGLEASRFHVLESRGRNRTEINAEIREGRFIAKYWDARIFGNTFLEKNAKGEGRGADDAEAGDDKPKKGKAGKKSADADGKIWDSIKTGAVQFGLGVSVAPIAIERMSLTNKAGVEGDKDRGMAPLGYRIVQHGVYCMPFFVNPTAAVKSGCVSEDVELLYRLIPLAYSHTASFVRPFVGVRHAWVAEHKNSLGSCSDFALLDALRPVKKIDPEKPSVGWDDYEVPTELPAALAGRVKPLRDLVAELA